MVLSNQDNPNNIKKDNEESSVFTLKTYYYALGLTGAVIPVVVAVFIFFFPQNFSWLGEDHFMIMTTLFSIGFIHFTLFAVNEVFKKNILFTLAVYAYVIFFLFLIYITGGINSSFIFTLFFPIIATSVFLDRKSTKVIGIVTTLAFAVIFFFLEKESMNGALITKHIIEVFLIGVISYLVYSLVMEIVHQRYEREETTKKLTEVVQIDRLKSDFLSVAQHQLRTPLSGVKWTLEMIKASPDIPSDTISLIDAGLERVKNAIEVVNQMLKTAEESGGSLKLQPEKLDIVGITQSIIAELNFIIIKKSVKISLISPSSIIINADRDKIKPSLANIIDNAIKYSPKGHVTVTIEEIPLFVRITIKDNGIGIASGDLPYIFYRLHRCKNAVALEPDESGIGLYISKKIIELHGGTIFVSSELNVGTTVTIELPR